MPKTKFQDFIFTIIMVFIMVYCMTLYNMALNLGLSHTVFTDTLREMWHEAIAAFLIQKFLVGPAVRKLVFRFFKPGIDKPIFIILATAGLTVSFMAPIMTLFVTILHHGLTTGIIILWLPKLIMNFPFALCMQVFYIGPLVRFIFRKIFQKQLTEETSCC